MYNKELITDLSEHNPHATLKFILEDTPITLSMFDSEMTESGETITLRFKRVKTIEEILAEKDNRITRLVQDNQYLESINRKLKTDDTIRPILETCERYNIPVENLAATIEQYIADDNDGYMGYHKCNDCTHTSDCSHDHEGCNDFKSRHLKT